MRVSFTTRANQLPLFLQGFDQPGLEAGNKQSNNTFSAGLYFKSHAEAVMVMSGSSR